MREEDAASYAAWFDLYGKMEVKNTKSEMLGEWTSNRMRAGLATHHWTVAGKEQTGSTWNGIDGKVLIPRFLILKDEVAAYIQITIRR